MCAEAEAGMTGDTSWCRCFREGQNWWSRSSGNELRSCAREGRHWWMHWMRFCSQTGNHNEEKSARQNRTKEALETVVSEASETGRRKHGAGSSKEDRNAELGDFTTTWRVIPISMLAIVIGVICAFVALALLRLIGLFTNLFYFGRWSTTDGVARRQPSWGLQRFRSHRGRTHHRGHGEIRVGADPRPWHTRGD